MQLIPRVEAEAGSCHGQPIIAGTRVLVSTVVGQLSSGATIDEVASAYGIEREDVLACLSFAADLLSTEEVRALEVRILVDENLPLLLATSLAAAGHDTEHARTCGLRGRPDTEVLAWATARKQVLFTHG